MKTPEGAESNLMKKSKIKPTKVAADKPTTNPNGQKKPVAKIIIADKLYVRDSLVNERFLKRNFETHVYQEKMCDRCDLKPYRFSHACATCPGHLAHIVLWDKHEIEKKQFYSVPIGSYKETLDNLELGDMKVLDLRNKVPMKHNLKFTKELFKGQVVNGVETVNQQEIVDEFIKHEMGVIEAPARSGKTIIAINISIKRKQRTLVLAHTDDLLKQFMAKLKEFSNLNELEKKTGRRIAGIVKKDSDFDEIDDIVCCTYQKFIKPGSGEARLKKYIRKKFGQVLIDENHKVAATCYSKVIHNINAFYKTGLSATQNRKDQLDQIVTVHILSKNKVVGKSKSLTPKLEIIETKIKPKHQYSNFTSAMNFLSENVDRNKIIVRKVFEILRSDERRNIIIPVMRVEHVKTLVKMINHQAKVNNIKRNENWDETRLAMEFHGKTKNRDQVLTYAKKGGKTRVVVIMRALTLGLDVPAWTDMIYGFLFANPPQCYQLMCRVMTAAPNKPTPAIYTLVDDLGISYGCFRVSYLQTMLPMGMNISLETKKLAYKLIGNLSYKKSNYSNSSSDPEISANDLQEKNVSLKDMWT